MNFKRLSLILFLLLSLAIPVLAEDEVEPPDEGPPPPASTVPKFFKPEGRTATFDNLGRVKRVPLGSVSLTKESTLDRTENLIGSPEFPAEGTEEFHSFDIGQTDPAKDEVYASSPFSNFRETIQSKKFSEDIYSKEMSQSPLALTTATWAMVEPAFFSAMSAAGSTALAMSQNRYLADQTTRNIFAANKSQGEVLLETYDSCVARVAKLKGYAAAQEACLGGWERPAAANIETGTSASDLMSFGSHPLHPSKNLPVPEPFVGEEDDTKVIKLTHLIFMRALKKAETSTNTDYKPFVNGLVTAWKDLFGDVEYALYKTEASGRGERRGNSLDAHAMELSTDKLAPLFEYPLKLDDEFREQINRHIRSGVVSAFKAYMRYKTDAVYYNLVRVMYKHCKFFPTVGGTAPGGGAPTEAETRFWTPSESTDDSTPNITIQEASTLSTKSFIFNRYLGNALYEIFEREGKVIADVTCDTALKVDDPNASASLKTLRVGDDRNKWAIKMSRFYYRMAEAIAASQINEMLNEMRKMVESMSGGSFEKKAKAHALQLIEENAGREWDYYAARNRIEAEMQALYQTLDGYIAEQRDAERQAQGNVPS